MANTSAVLKIRRNHALEHATVALLLERGVHPPLGGYSVAGGYVIWSKAPIAEVTEASVDALKLLNAGHRDLAISPFCGTNLVTSAVLGGLAATLVRGNSRGIGANFRAAIAAIATASLLSRPVGEFIQRRFTTKPEPAGLQINSVREILHSPVSIIWVSTSS
tara:strand:- start:11 stop:499 length:489 start_codon:yes stop_codon:yes gene_type:complete